MKSYFINLPPRFAIALWLLLLAAAHPAFGAVTFTGDTSNGTTVIVGNTGNGSLLIDDGSSLSNTSGIVGFNPGSSGEVNVSGGNWTNSGALSIGMFGNGSLTITDGTVANTIGRVGYYSGSSGEVNVSGGNWTNSASLEIGWGGTGNLTITGGTVSNTSGTVGSIPGSTGTVTVSGGNWTNSGNLTIGSAGNGTLNLTGIGTVSVGGGLVTLANTAGKTGTLNLGNGTAAGTLSAATITGGSGTAVVNINQSGSYTLGSNMTGSLSLNHLGTGTTTLTGNNTFTGTTTISAGTLQIGSVNALGSGGNITFGGGTLQFGSGITTDVSSRLKNSVTAIQIDTDNNNITFASDVDATNTGGLTKLGSGNLTLTGNNTYTGGTTIKNGTMELTVGGSISSAGNMTIGSASGDNGTLTISGGNVSNTNGSVGFNSNSNGTVNMSGGNWTNSAILYIGRSGTGSLTITNGTISNTYGTVGDDAGSNGTVTVSGGNWTNNDLFIGNRGTGSLTISGGIVTTTSGTLGREGIGSNGTVNVSGGTWVNSGSLSVGRSGTGSLTISSGTVSNTSSEVGFRQLSFIPSGTGTVNVSGGAWTNSGSLSVGKGGNGSLTISGGTVTNTNGEVGSSEGSLFLIARGTGTVSVSGGTWENSGELTIGRDGTGSLAITGGNVTNTSGNIGLNAGSTGVATVSGGNWTNSNYFTVGDSGNGTLNLSGGLISNTGNYSFIGRNTGSTGVANVSGGNWTNGENLIIGAIGNGTLNITGGTVSNTAGFVALENSSMGVVNVSGGTWSNSDRLRLGRYGNGTLNLTGGNVSIAGGAGNLTVAVNASSTGILNIGNGSAAGNLQAARVTAGSGTAIVNFNHSGNHSFSPIMEGNLTVNKLGSGTTTLSSNNTYTGGTTVNAGTLLVTGSTGSVVVNNSGTLGGNGTLGAVTINSGGTIAPGNSPGTISVGNMTWNAGGNYNWQLANATASAGSGWDLISSTGTLTITANATNKFTINLWSLSGTGPDASGIAANFDAQSNYSWNIGTFSNINGFDASYFDIVTAASNGTDGFVGGNGTFFVNSTTTTLVLNYAAAPTPTPTPTPTRGVWDTGSGNYSVASQWKDNAPPTSGDHVSFTGSGGTSINDNALSLAGGISFDSNATGSYVTNGTALTLGTGGIVNNSVFDQTVAMNLALAANQSFTAATGNLAITGNIFTNGHTLTSDGARTTSISGNISGEGSLVKSGSGTTILTGSNTYTGGTTVLEGILAGTTQSLRGTIVNNGVVNFEQSFNGNYAGVMSGTGSLIKSGAGAVLLSGNNSFSGGTTINSGVLAASVVSGYLVTLNPNAFGSGSVTINAGGAMFVPSTTPVGPHLSIGGDLTLNNGTITFYDIGTSPAGQDLRIDVAGNFTNAGSGGVFDFSQVEALGAGNYTLVSYNGTNFATSAIGSRAGVGTTLQGSFSMNGSSLVYTVLGAQSSGTDIQNNGGPNTPIVSNYTINQTGVVTIGENNTVAALTFNSGGSLNIQSNGVLNITSGALNVENGSSVVGGGTLVAPVGLNKDGTGELDFTNNVVVTGTAAVNAGLLSVNGQLSANEVVVNPNATLGGAGVIIASNVIVNGNLSPGNSPGTLNVVGNLVLTGANSTIIEIASPTNFDRIVVTDTATLGGTLNAVGYEGYSIAPGSRFDFLQAGSIVGAYDSITAPEGLRARFLNSGTVGTLLFGPGSYVMMAINQNQRNVAEALDTFILATEGDPLTVSVALDSLTTEQFPAAFDQIMPGFYESLGDILIEQTYNQAQLLTQRLGSVRLGATGFQAVGMSQPIKYDKDGKSAADAKTASPIVEAPVDTNWNSWVIANGEFSLSRGLSGVPNYKNNAGGFLVGADCRLSENFAAGLFAGYEYSYAKYDGGSSTRGNSALFGLYGTYTHEDGYYADAMVSGGYTGFQTRRSIEFSTIDRTASADPNSGQFSAALNLGKDFEIGKFTLGPIVGAQYTYAGIGGFTESGADSLDLALGQQNANSFRTNLGARLAYNWEVGSNITLIPEVRGFWMHEFLNNPRNISSALDGGNGASFDYETSAPYRNSVFGGVGISAKFGDRWSASVFYNVNFGGDGYTNNIISTSLGFSF